MVLHLLARVSKNKVQMPYKYVNEPDSVIYKAY